MFVVHNMVAHFIVLGSVRMLYELHNYCEIESVCCSQHGSSLYCSRISQNVV